MVHNNKGLWLSSFQQGTAANLPPDYQGDGNIALYWAYDTQTLYVAGNPGLGGTPSWVPLGGGNAHISTDAATLTLAAADSGKTFVMPDLTADIAIALPEPAAGLNYTFVYGGVAADAQDWNISTGDNAAYFKGGLLYVDDAPAADSVAGDGNSNSIVHVLTPEPGTRVNLYCDGTNWYLSGVVASASAPTFADQP